MSNGTSSKAVEAGLLSYEETRRLDQAAIARGVPGSKLMERAGAFVAEVATSRWPSSRSIAILAGAGNNGGDAYVAARHLAERGCDVTLFALAEPADLRGDAALAAAGFRGAVLPIDRLAPDGFDLVVDGLFGAGLSRPVEGAAAAAIEAANGGDAPILAIDLPSGIDGDTGAVLGTAIRAEATATFVRRKPGHLLMPGRAHCGAVHVGAIGIEEREVEALGLATFANEPPLFARELRFPGVGGHKYDRGHAVVFSGPATKTGAARLAAAAALRGGAGLVTLFSPAAAVLVNAAHLTAVMLRRCEDETDLDAALEDARLNAFAIGPGFGRPERARAFVLRLLAAGRHVVIDADAITAFAEEPDVLFEAIGCSAGAAVLTPHAGEFARLFPDLAQARTGKIETARAAAARSGAVVVLKGPDTVVAAPDGRAAINATGTPWLATAGSGDVLTGIVAGLLAQAMPAFEAACAAAWMHGKAAETFGPGLVAEDLPAMLPKVLAGLLKTEAGKGELVRPE